VCTRFNDPLTTSVAGSVKNIAMTFIGAVAFGDFRFAPWNALGLGLSMAGAVWYATKSAVKVRARARAVRRVTGSPPPSPPFPAQGSGHAVASACAPAVPWRARARAVEGPACERAGRGRMGRLVRRGCREGRAGLTRRSVTGRGALAPAPQPAPPGRALPPAPPAKPPARSARSPGLDPNLTRGACSARGARARARAQAHKRGLAQALLLRERDPAKSGPLIGRDRLGALRATELARNGGKESPSAARGADAGGGGERGGGGGAAGGGPLRGSPAPPGAREERAPLLARRAEECA